jgi:hypothetical protein
MGELSSEQLPRLHGLKMNKLLREKFSYLLCTKSTIKPTSVYTLITLQYKTSNYKNEISFKFHTTYSVIILLSILLYVYYLKSQSQWPRGLRRGSAASRMVGLLVRIPPGAWMSVVSVVCCHVEVPASG